jgi:DNA-binding CsgD family transcriptional regulator
MYRAEITAELVAEAQRMLADGVDHATIAQRLDITPYVVGLLACNRHLKACGKTPRCVSRPVPNMQRGIDAVTIRMVQRMLAAGVLRQGEIAREVGISSNMVAEVAHGKRLPVSTWRPYLQEGERFLPAPIRCSVCRANISVVPCRACQARREAAAKKII